jgi:hypothetical protein
MRTAMVGPRTADEEEKRNRGQLYDARPAGVQQMVVVVSWWSPTVVSRWERWTGLSTDAIS